VTGSGAISLAIRRTSSNLNTYSSRESSSNPPLLEVESAPTGGGPETVVYAVGDGADGSQTSRDLANYVAGQHPDYFFYLGDVYEAGTAAEFTSNYEPAYGPLASITDPAIGNHEYANRSTGYYAYWMSKRGWTPEQAKHRSYIDPVSGWQIITYSSETDMVTEALWVAGEVAKYPGTCRVVIDHRGRYAVADSNHGDNFDQDPVWSVIANRTALNLVGHNHLYGRLAPIDGVTVIVSGAGGHDFTSLGGQQHTVVASKTGVATVTRLVLRHGSANFSQVDKNGTIYDSGAVTCSEP
jgi:Calcineurin-like phosphoesterase